MPASRAVLIDLEQKGLRPDKAAIKLGKDGKFVADAKPVSEAVVATAAVVEQEKVEETQAKAEVEVTETEKDLEPVVISNSTVSKSASDILEKTKKKK